MTAVTQQAVMNCSYNGKEKHGKLISANSVFKTNAKYYQVKARIIIFYY
jgi:hypothetical protein